MKKVLYGVALTLLASASVGSLQSCKDDVNDLKTQTSYDLKNLQLEIEKKLKELEDEIGKKQDEGDYVTTDELSDYATLKYVNKLIYGVETDTPDPALVAEIEKGGGLLEMIKGALDKVSCDCASFKEQIENLLYPKGENQPADYEDSANMIAYLQGKIGANKASIDEITRFLAGYLEDGKGEQEGEYKTLQQRLQAITDDIETLQNDVKTLKDDIAVIKERLDNIESAMTQAFNYLDALNGRLDNLITSIKVERAVSPVFGDLSLPVGIKSNVLFNWYGYSDRGAELDFPTNDPGMVGQGINLPSVGLTKIPNGYFDDEVELGNVYVTLNPVGHVFNGNKLTFTTSAGNDLEFQVEVNASDYELKHGYTRAEEEINGNGFYEGKVTVPKANIESIKLSLDEKLMTSMKNVVKDPTKRNAASLIKALYDQMSGMMPAYALRYDWRSNYYTGTEGKENVTVGEGADATTTEIPEWSTEVSVKSYAVLSGYDLAVAAARPLGFNFLKGEGASSDKVPTIGNLDNFVKELIDKNMEKIKIQGEDMTVLDHEIGFKNGEISIDLNPDNENELIAIVDGVTVKNKTGKVVTLKGVKTDPFTDPAEASKYINKALSIEIAKVIDGKDEPSRTTQAKVEASVDIALLQMQKQINSVLEDVNGQIHEAFDGMGDSAQSYIDKANRAIDLYNKVANKINNFLKDPNHYLQAAAFYAAGNNMGILSSNPNSPTVFTGSGNTITLYLSTYTGEIIAPAYKKYVAVTDGPGASNLNSGDLNKVLDGSRIAVDVNVAGFESGKTYELTYQAVDYRGFYSTRKCYIQVKK